MDLRVHFRIVREVNSLRNLPPMYLQYWPTNPYGTCSAQPPKTRWKTRKTWKLRLEAAESMRPAGDPDMKQFFARGSESLEDEEKV